MSDRKSINNHENETQDIKSILCNPPKLHMYVILNLVMFNCLIEVF